MRALYIAVGGGVGSLARYWLADAVQRVSGGEFPTGILVVNVLGSFVLGVLMGLSLDRGVISEDMRVALSVGVCGGFTTMSSFSYQTFGLLFGGAPALALLNVGATVLICIAAVGLGAFVARILN